jgi:hypothetical protein
MFARLNAPHKSKRCHQSDRAVAAHPEISNVIEEDHPGGTGGIGGLAQQSPHYDVGPSRFIDDRRAKAVMLAPETFEPF